MKTSRQLADAFLDQLRDMTEHPDRYPRWKIGIPELDRAIGGIMPGRLYYIGGEQKSGKSAFMLTCAIRLAKQNVQVGYISLEMGEHEIGGRVFAHVGQVDMTKFRDLELEEADWTKLQKAYDEICDYKAYWDYGVSTLKGIEQVVAEHPSLQVLIVDYIQLMHAQGRSRAEEIQTISRGLKALTLGPNRLTLLVGSQLNRESLRGNMEDMHAFAQSSAIESDGDVGLLISRVKDQAGVEVPNQRRIKVAMSRVGGDNTSVDVYFNGARSYFSAQPETTGQTDLTTSWQDVHQPAYRGVYLND